MDTCKCGSPKEVRYKQCLKCLTNGNGFCILCRKPIDKKYNLCYKHYQKVTLVNKFKMELF